MKKLINYFRSLVVCSIIFYFITPFRLFSQIDELTNECKEHCLVLNNIDSGMFAEFVMVLGALNLYDQGLIGGVEVNFNKGFYLDPSQGPNWWEYFFEPINLEKKDLPQRLCSFQEGVALAYSGFALSTHRNAQIIQKYIHIKSHIQQEVKTFINQNFEQHFVIGIHYRGTDKGMEWPLVAYEKTYHILNQMIDSLPPFEKSKLRLYVATDDQYFLTYLESLFPSIIIYNNFVRSIDGTPLHYGTNHYSSNYQKGKEVLIDCLLMSKCQMLLRPVGSSVRECLQI